MTITVTAPNGATVDFPDGTDHDTIHTVMVQNFHPDAGAPTVGTVEDIAKGAGSGLVSGITGTLGMAGDAGNLLGAGVDYAGSKLGLAPDKVQQFKDLVKAGTRFTPAGAMLQSPSSQDLKSELESATGPLSYKPQTVAGGVAQKVAEFLPGLIGGPEGLATKALTRVVAPALASEAAGKLTEGTAAQPYAELGGALVGAGGASVAAQKFKAMAAARQAASAVPSGEDLLATAGKQFDQARDMNVVVKPDFATNAAADMRSAVKSFDPEVGGKGALAAADRLEGLAATGAPVQMNDAENIRKQLVSLKTSPDASVREAAKTGIKSLQASQMALAPADVLAGDAGAYRNLTADAVGNWAAGKRSAAVTGKMDLAGLNSGTAGSGANQDNNLRQAIKQLARPMNNTNVPVARTLGFNNPEIDAIKRAATGTAVGNTARYLGKLAPTGTVSGLMSAGAGFGAGGLPGAVALPAAGYIAKKIGDLSTARAVSALDSLVRSRSPLAAHVAAQLPAQIVQQLPAKTTRLLRTMVLANPAFQQASQAVGQQNAN